MQQRVAIHAAPATAEGGGLHCCRSCRLIEAEGVAGGQHRIALAEVLGLWFACDSCAGRSRN